MTGKDRGIKKLHRLMNEFNARTAQFPNIAYIKGATIGECLDDLFPHGELIPVFGEMRIMGMRIVLAGESEYTACEDEPLYSSAPPPQEASAELPPTEQDIRDAEQCWENGFQYSDPKKLFIIYFSKGLRMERDLTAALNALAAAQKELDTRKGAV